MLWDRATLKSVTVPGGVLLLAVAVLLHSGWLTLALPALSFLYDCALIGGVLLAWRFHSSRVFFAILVLFLAQQAVGLPGGVQTSPATTAWTTLTTAAVLVPLNFLLIALMRERGFTVSGIAPFGLLLFVQTVFVGVLNRSPDSARPSPSHHIPPIISLPGSVLVAFAVAETLFLVRSLFHRKPADSALLWSLASFFLSLHFNGTPRVSTLYSATAMCILAASIVETSYLLAYHDELTTLPSRRAFNDALLRLQDPYSIAAVDIDHFKRFNDTYGHDTGDQILRLVASRLAQVTGGGQPYRCGGEEFVILFPGKTTSDVVEHLEQLRSTIQDGEFRQRGTDRRQAPRGPERRNERTRGRGRKGNAIRQRAREKASTSLFVTVSIGVASSTTEKPYPELVLEAADKALYRAKEKGRNRLETALPPRRQNDRLKAPGIA